MNLEWFGAEGTLNHPISILTNVCSSHYAVAVPRAAIEGEDSPVG